MPRTDDGQVTTVLQRIGGLLALLNPVKLIMVGTELVRAVLLPPPGAPDELGALASAYRDAAAAVGRAGLTPRPFLDAAEALTVLAAAVREHRARHAELRRRIRIRACVAVYRASLAAADRAASRFADVAGQARAAAGVAGGLTPAESVLLAAQVVSVPGVGDRYDDGILTAAQLRAAGQRRAELSEEDRTAFAELLDRAGAEVERAWLYKALTAGRTMAELAEFAGTIRGRDPAWLDGHLSLIDRGGPGEQDRLGADVRQYEDTTCGTTCLIVAHAEADPVYALGLTEGDFTANFTAERARVHNVTNVLYPKAFGTSPEGMARYLSEHTGTPHGWHPVDDTVPRKVSAAVREVATAVNAGYPVPLLVGGVVPRHYVLAVGHSGAEVLIYEPTMGRTVLVAERDFLEGTLKESAGFDHLQVVVLPG